MVLTSVLLAALAGGSHMLATMSGGPNWGMIGNDPSNSRSQPLERTIDPTNAHRLAAKWVATTTGDVSGTPAVVNGVVYFGDFGGTLWALDAATGEVIWSHKVSDYTGVANDIARTSPSVAGNTLVVGSLTRPVMLGIEATTGHLRWKTQVHPDTQAAGHGIMTGSPVLAGDTIYTGVSANGAGGPNATFRGAIVALKAQTGELLWRTYSLPDNGGVPGGYAGATMFSPPAVNSSGRTRIRHVRAALRATGQRHGVSRDKRRVHRVVRTAGFLPEIDCCVRSENGRAAVAYRVQGHDPWLRACGSLPSSVTWCAPESDGVSWDMGGSGPNVMRLRMNGRWRNVVGVGEKSGVYLLLDAKTGEFIWNTLLSPGGDQGGMNWGTAFDGQHIYTSLTNHRHIPYQMTQNGITSGLLYTGGSWAALDPITGSILWQVPDEQTEVIGGATVNVWDLAPVSAANGVVYVASMAKSADQNQMFALDAATGQLLWQFGAGASVNAAPAISNGSVYWGSGREIGIRGERQQQAVRVQH